MASAPARAGWRIVAYELLNRMFLRAELTYFVVLRYVLAVVCNYSLKNAARIRLSVVLDWHLRAWAAADGPRTTQQRHGSRNLGGKAEVLTGKLFAILAETL